MFTKIALRTAACCLLISSLNPDTFGQQRKLAEGMPFVYYPRQKTNFFLSRHDPARSYDGTNNNIDPKKVEWGATDVPLYRELPAQFGPLDPKNAMGGTTRPSARQISNALVDEPVTTFNSRGLSAFIYVWGQFLDHDITLTPGDTIEKAAISMPLTEKVFTAPIPFSRSQIYPGSGVTSPRDQMNIATSWVDASVVYGSDSARAKWLRTFRNGKLKTSSGNFLPYNTTTGELSAPIDPKAPSMANDGNHQAKAFVAGDVRASEHPGLLSLQTLFVREHNRICDQLIAQGMRNDEQIYQRARKEVGALIEAITYQEFLPAIGITLSPYGGYKPWVRPDIMNTFATAGYRLGHSMVADDILLRDNACEDVGPGELDLVNAFWSPQLVTQYGVEPFLKGFAVHTQYETDTKINSVLRNFLFGDPNNSVRFGVDLASLNIQRGRDHGLPDYNTVRKYYTGSRARDFSDITSNGNLADSLRKLYGSVDNIDLWIGALAEDHLPGKSVGITLYRLLKAQFENLRDGDYYFYLNDPFLPQAVLLRMKNTKLSDVIKRNTLLTNLQDNVFFSALCPGDSTAEVQQITTKAAVMPENSPLNSPKLFPNPARSLLNVDLGSNVNSASLLEIFNANGVLMKTVNVAAHVQTTSVDINPLQAGTYVMKVINGGFVKTLKFVKVAD